MSTRRRRQLGSWGRGALPLLLLAAFAFPAAGQERYHQAVDPERFPVPPALVPNVEFWRAVFSKYPSSQTVIHDNLNVDVVFSVVDVSDLVESGRSAVAIERARDARVRDEIRKYQRVLRRLAGDTRAGASAADVERVRALYAASSRRTTNFRAAADRVRGQGGLKDTFAEAIRRSGLFMPAIERILKQHGVPVQVRCMPFVESMYNHEARSKVGASGVWQFMPGTGRLYLQIDSAVDARHDVLLAADGAARLLRDNYERVRSWPLALTAYNHGIAGMERAVRQLGTSDIAVIAERYESRSFGFASRNFYPEFIAAVTVFADRASLFPGVEPLPPLAFDEFVAERYVSLLDLAGLTRTEVDALAALNPALDEEVVRGRMLVPARYPLRVPVGARVSFEQAFAELPAARKRDSQLNRTYRVARGDTLGAIARRFGTTTATLQRANGIARANRIRVGQVLQVGVGGSWTPLVWKPPAVQKASAQSAVRVHIVRAGETLYQIARRYGLTIAAIVAANDDLSSPNRIPVGMALSIPAR